MTLIPAGLKAGAELIAIHRLGRVMVCPKSQFFEIFL
jgi:hypothetical protein